MPCVGSGGEESLGERVARCGEVGVALRREERGQVVGEKQVLTRTGVRRRHWKKSSEKSLCDIIFNYHHRFGTLSLTRTNTRHETPSYLIK